MIRLVIIALVIINLVNQVSAGERIAFVIGNSNYENIEKLENPVNDAKLIMKALRDSAFTVVSAENLKRDQLHKFFDVMVSTMKDHVTENPGIIIDSVLLYYAGHAVQIKGENFIVPVDVRDSEDDILQKGLGLNIILNKLESIGANSQIVILDACRDNPFSEQLGPSGLAEIEATQNTYVAFATKPGGVASDGDGDNSPFTSNLANEMAVQNLPIEEMFKRVRKAVIKETAGEQIPWDSSSLTEDFRFKPTGDFGELEIEETTMMKDQKIWDRSVNGSNDIEAYRAYLMMFPNGLHASEAKEFLNELD